MLCSLAYIPLLQPLPLPDAWLPLLLLPLALAVASVYKAVRVEDINQLPREIGSLMLMITGFMVVTGLVLYFVFGRL